MSLAFNLSGKVALITGGAGLLGIEHAHALLEIGSGIILVDIDKEKLNQVRLSLQELFPKQLINNYCVDITNRDDVLNLSNLLKLESLSIDVLVNNAALNPKLDNGKSLSSESRLEAYSLETWHSEISVGLTGSLICTQIFGSQMAKKSGGVILNIASDLSVISPDQRIYQLNGLNEDLQPVKPVSYSVIKAGIVGLTRYTATYWAKDGVRCNALSPGGVYNDQDKGFVDRLVKLIPLGRMAFKDEYRGSVQYLCSDASKYMNGQNIVVDGGRSVW